MVCALHALVRFAILHMNEDEVVKSTFWLEKESGMFVVVVQFVCCCTVSECLQSGTRFELNSAKLFVLTDA